MRYISGDLKNGTGSINLFYHNTLADSIVLISEQSSQDELLNGPLKEYYMDGKLKFEGNYVNDTMVGFWHYYNPYVSDDHIIKKYKLSDGIKKDSSELYCVEPSLIPFLDISLPQFHADNIENFRYYIAKELEYPQKLGTKGVQGKVYTRFYINQIGELVHVEILNESEEEFEKEAIRVINKAPNWIPAFQDNIPITTSFVFPIAFMLQ